MSNPVSRLNPETLPDSSLAGYSQISIAQPGTIAFVSGQVAWSRDGSPMPSTLGGQAELVVRNARGALAALGATPRDLLMVRVYLVDLTDGRMGEVMPHLHALFDGERPSLTGIGVAALAGPDLQIEIEMTVRVPD